MTDAAPGTATNNGHGLACPVCRVDLVMSERQGIEIDYCPKCRGVWLDRGELDKIIERSAVEAQPTGTPSGAPREYARDDYDDHGRGHGNRRGRRGHGSFLDRLFD